MKTIITVYVLLSVSIINADILINEFLAGSDTCCGADIFDGSSEDFVELYNYGTEPININGWGFSDTDGVITTVAPDTSIAPGDFLVLWYTGDNNGFPEVNEKLSKDGETIFIVDADGNPLISYDFGPQTDDISYGRNPDGSDTWEYFSIPSPGQSNVIENSPPGPFYFLSPEDNDTLVIDLDNQNDSIIFSWEESVDPDGDNIQYTFNLYGLDMTASFSNFYNHTLDNTELSFSNDYLSNLVFNFYSEPYNWFYFETGAVFPVYWSVFSSDGIATFGEIDFDDIGYENNHFVLYIDLSNADTSGVETPTIIINEFLSISDNCCGSDIFDGSTEDFVELYNYGTEPVSINGWGFSDTDGTITTVAPDTSIAPGDFLVLWYTGDNNGFPEINEKLSGDGETIYIANEIGIEIISYDFGPQIDDVSYGRSPDGSDFWTHMPPTPGQSNIINTPPNDFSLTFPLVSDTLTADLVSQGDSLLFIDNIHFYWEESNDPDQVNIQYSFRLYIQCCDGIDIWSTSDMLDNNNNYISHSYLFNILSEMVDGPIFSVPHEIHWSVKATDGIDESAEVSDSFYIIFNDYLDIVNETIPESFTVFSAFPNPFNPFTTISYMIPNDGFVDVTIFDMMGREIKNLVSSKQSNGYKSIRWDATNNQNQAVTAGVYLYKIKYENFVTTQKMILLK